MKPCALLLAALAALLSLPTQTQRASAAHCAPGEAAYVQHGSMPVPPHLHHTAALADFPPDSQAFLRENDEAMNRMMQAMMVPPRGNIDRDFVEMMIPHHQGAIDMAKAVLSHTRNEQLRRLAQEIIVTQQQEIAAMRLAVGDPLPTAEAAPTQIAPASR